MTAHLPVYTATQVVVGLTVFGALVLITVLVALAQRLPARRHRQRPPRR